MAVAGLIVGGGILWMMYRDRQAARKAEFDAVTQRNWNQGQQDARAAEEAAKAKAEEARDDDAPVNDW